MSRNQKDRRRGRVNLNRIQSEPRDPNRRAWPVVRAYVPVRDAWWVGGCGTAGIVRLQPDGLCSYSIFPIELTKGGLCSAFGAENKREEEIAEELADLSKWMPPFEEGDAALAARYAWGAYAMSLDNGFEWARELRTLHLGMLPTIGGARNWWLEQFIGEMMPLKLLLAAGSVMEIDVPRYKEVSVAVWMEFDLPDTDQFLQMIRSRPEEFQPTDAFDEAESFLWILERRWNPGERMPHFLIAIRPGKVLGHAPSLSMAARLVMHLREITGGSTVLSKVDWGDTSELAIEPPGLEVLEEA